MQLRWIVLGLFLLIYGFVSFNTRHRAKAVWIGVALLLGVGWWLRGQDPERVLAPLTIVREAINWNVLAVLAGAMLIADLFVESKVPAWLAAGIARRLRKPHLILLGICALAGFLSMLMDNVTTVLIVAPLAIAVARATHSSPVPLLVGVAVSANLQGAATLIGDPPSMMLAAELRMTFNDFFVYHGKPSIFFAMQAGAVAGGAVLYLWFRREQHGALDPPTERVLTWIPTIFVATMIAFLFSASFLDPDFRWLAGTGMATLGLVATAWHWRRDPATTVRMLRRYDVPTMFFLTGVFVLAYALQGFGWVKALAALIARASGESELGAFALVVWGSVLISAFVDNIPYVAAALPVTQSLSGMVGGSPFLYAGGLLMGACLGGNVTPIGASCNIVVVGQLRREGYAVGFWDFARIGLPFTLAATAVGSTVLWLLWS